MNSARDQPLFIDFTGLQVLESVAHEGLGLRGMRQRRHVIKRWVAPCSRSLRAWALYCTARVTWSLPVPNRKTFSEIKNAGGGMHSMNTIQSTKRPPTRGHAITENTTQLRTDELLDLVFLVRS